MGRPPSPERGWRRTEGARKHAEEAPGPPEARPEKAAGPEEAAAEEVIRPCPHFRLPERRLRDAARLLAEGWSRHRESGIVTYDPAASEKVEAPPFRFHYLPARASRPGARRDPIPPAEGIHLPHAPCPFDGEEFVREREVLRVSRAERTYHIVCNRYPVTPLHFLAVRSESEPAGTLPQKIHGPAEIEDSLILLREIGEPYRLYFNSNRGADGSQSGSSVNHWHLQLFPHASESPFLSRPARIARRMGELAVGRIEPWPASHLFVEGGEDGEAGAAEVLWQWISTVHVWNSAYNMEAVALPGRRFRAFLFPRSPAPDEDVPGAGRLSANFGGWELSGDIVIPTREILDRVRDDPGEARRLTEKRLRETTREL